MSSTLSKIRKKNLTLIGNSLKELRKNNGLTLDELSKKIKTTVESLVKYESDFGAPNLARLVKFAELYGVSIDFLVLWNKTNYIHSMELFRLAEIIDKLDQVKRFQIESTAITFLENENKNHDILFKEDTINLGDDIHFNLTTLRDLLKIPQKKIAEFIGITQSGVANYESSTTPTIDKLVKLSELFGTSIHSIVTGKKLTFQIENKGLKNTIIKADQLLSIKDKSFLILLMNKIIKESKAA